MMNESFIIANRTDVGRAREHNEDSMVTFDSPNGRVVAVCDGMGGQAAGDLASRLACDIITDILTNNRFKTPTEAITMACMAANKGILHRVSQNPELDGMGATCVMVIIKDGLVYYGWVGDSRIYYIHNGTISQISRDQSYVQQLVDAGQISAAEAENHPQKNEITNALGLETMTPPELCTTPLSPEPGSMLLLCSDGLTGMVDDNTIRSIATDAQYPLQRRVDALVEAANANGGQDNITVQLIEFLPAGARRKRAPIMMRNMSGDSGAASKSRWMVYAAAAIAVIIIAAVVFFTIGSKKTDTSGNSKSEDRIEDNRSIKSNQNQNRERSHQSVQPSQPSQSSETTTIVVREPQKPSADKKPTKEQTRKKKEKDILNQQGSGNNPPIQKNNKGGKKLEEAMQEQR